MVNNQYSLRYLPIFFDDVNNITNYIKNTLLNPQAANDLLDSIENAILQRLPICESFEPYNSKKIRQYPYFCRNFSQFAYIIFNCIIVVCVIIVGVIRTTKTHEEVLK